jgi:NAD(P)-dependent dehydrogenase (short-subunit alcohol dehydrogenase family)
MPSAIIIGVGPGIGQAVARRFAAEGFDVGLVARSAASLEGVSSALVDASGQNVTIAADAANESALRAALDTLVDRFGVPDVLVYNAAVIQWDSLGELSAREHLDAWAVNVVGAITAVAHLGPRMAARGRGTVLITGGMPTPLPDVMSLSLGKAGVRALAELLAGQFVPAGVQITSVTVGGAVAPGTTFDPDEIAERYWQLHCQPRDQWKPVVLYSPQTQDGDDAD